MALDDRAARLIRMAKALEESITRLEAQRGAETRETVRRLRALQNEILAALYQLEGDGPV
jgi:hypothetical protein